MGRSEGMAMCSGWGRVMFWCKGSSRVEIRSGFCMFWSQCLGQV